MAYAPASSSRGLRGSRGPPCSSARSCSVAIPHQNLEQRADRDQACREQGKAALDESRLDALASQINPHFL
jgi:hypothetical protein